MAANEIDNALYLIMSSDTTLASYFTTPLKQILYGDDQYFQNTPRIVFEKISDPTGSQKPEKWQRWGFNITHTNFLECEAIQNRVVYLFSDGHGTKGRDDDETPEQRSGH